jgi:hypothetical protein
MRRVARFATLFPMNVRSVQIRDRRFIPRPVRVSDLKRELAHL